MKKISEMEMAERIRAYFSSRKKPRCNREGQVLTDKNGEILLDERPATVTGLALYLGFDSRESMLAVTHGKKAALIRKALLVIEEQAEEKLFCKDTFQGAKLFLSVNFKRWGEWGSDSEDGAGDLGMFSSWSE